MMRQEEGKDVEKIVGLSVNEWTKDGCKSRKRWKK
jgi:hypothetical protein